MSKKMFIMAATGLLMFSGNGLFASCSSGSCGVNGPIERPDPNSEGFDPCKEYRSGPARCTYPVTKFRKKTYCTKRCVKEPYTVKKKCVRYKDEYYTKTFCRKVPETYYTSETRYRDRWVTDEHCRYEPYTVYKTECVNLNEAPSQGCGCAAPADHGNNNQYDYERNNNQRDYERNNNQYDYERNNNQRDYQRNDIQPNADQMPNDAPISSSNGRKSRHY